MGTELSRHRILIICLALIIVLLLGVEQAYSEVCTFCAEEYGLYACGGEGRKWTIQGIEGTCEVGGCYKAGGLCNTPDCGATCDAADDCTGSCDGSNCQRYTSCSSTTCTCSGLTDCGSYTCSSGSCTTTCSQTCGATCDANGDCTGSDGCYGSARAYIYRSYYCTLGTTCVCDYDSLDPDSLSSYCTSCSGTSWNRGGETDPTTCCGDDSGEYAKSCTDSSANGACGGDTTACCTANTKCVDHNGACKATGSCYTFGSGGLASYCNSNSWEDPDESSSYCTASGCAYTWMANVPTGGTQCCGDDTTGDDSYYYNSTPTSAKTVSCERCLDGSYTSAVTYFGNGYYTDDLAADTSINCYYGDITCSAASGANGTNQTRVGNGNISGTTCYHGDIACSDGSSGDGSSCTLDANDICGNGVACTDCTLTGYLRQSITACYTSCTNDTQCAPGYNCKASSTCESSSVTYTEFSSGYNTTNLSLVGSSTSNINLTLQVNDNTTTVHWRNSTPMNSSWNLDAAVDLSQWFAYVNGSKYSDLNSVANITVYNLPFTRMPTLMKDGSFCTDCQILYWNTTTRTLMFNVTGFSNYTWIEDSLYCFFVENVSCPSNAIKLIGVKNDTAGYENSHAQNYSINTYNYSLCCNTTNSSHALGTGCNQQVVIRLSAEDNAHVELGNKSAYTFTACYNSSWGSFECEYHTDSCDANQTCLMSIAGSEGDNTTNAHVGSCDTYNQKVCCGIVQTPNYAPSKPTLSYPDNNNMTVFERKPAFNWSNSTDLNDDSITYTLNITCGPSCPAECEFGSASDISESTYTPSSPLCVDRVYNWTVSACDYALCNASDQFNFTIKSFLSLVLTVETVEFGSVSEGANRITDDLSPFPMVGRNDGNVLINSTINATALFSSVGMNDYYYMFRSVDNESGSIVSGCSQTIYTGMDNASQKDLFCNLSYDDSNDEARIHLNITVPINEPPGEKQSYIDVNPSCVDC